MLSLITFWDIIQPSVHVHAPFTEGLWRICVICRLIQDLLLLMSSNICKTFNYPLLSSQDLMANLPAVSRFLSVILRLLLLNTDLILLHPSSLRLDSFYSQYFVYRIKKTILILQGKYICTQIKGMSQIKLIIRMQSLCHCCFSNVNLL